VPDNFVCLDANILIRTVSQSREGCELEHWEALKAMVDKGATTLLLPTIVLMEFKKTVFHSPEEFVAASIKVKDRLKKLDDVWNEVRGDLQQHVYKQVDEWQEALQAKWRTEGLNIRGWLLTPQRFVKQLPFSADIWFRAKTRLIEGRFPKRTDEQGKSKSRAWEQDNDCSIIESLIDYFAEAGFTDKTRLLLCTENLDDFGFVRPSSKRNLLDLRLQEGLPPTEIFLDLDSLVKALTESKPIEPPQTKEEFEQVLKTKVEEDERVAREMTWGTLTETSLPTQQHVLGQNLERVHQHFIAQWDKAIVQSDIGAASSVLVSLAALVGDFVDQYEYRVKHDNRWKALVRFRDELQGFAHQMDDYSEQAFWSRGSRFMVDILNLAKAFQLA
jgi:hypothetical protein